MSAVPLRPRLLLVLLCFVGNDAKSKLARGGDRLPKQMLPPCVRAEARSQHWEDLMVFLPLRCMLGGRPGTFVELGAFTGVELSNSVMLERCYNWTGLLIEASTTNFAKLAVSGRKATKVHSAVCPGEQDSEVEFAVDGGETSGEPSLRTASTSKWTRKHHKALNASSSRKVKVPCSSLARILDRVGFPTIDVLFLDVEGAEAKVLQSVDPSRFSVVVMEAAGYPNDGGRLENDLEPHLLRAGFYRERRLESHARGEWNPVYVRSKGPLGTSDQCITCATQKQCRDTYLQGSNEV